MCVTLDLNIPLLVYFLIFKRDSNTHPECFLCFILNKAVSVKALQREQNAMKINVSEYYQWLFLTLVLTVYIYLYMYPLTLFILIFSTCSFDFCSRIKSNLPTTIIIIYIF